MIFESTFVSYILINLCWDFLYGVLIITKSPSSWDNWFTRNNSESLSLTLSCNICGLLLIFVRSYETLQSSASVGNTSHLGMHDAYWIHIILSFNIFGLVVNSQRSCHTRVDTLQILFDFFYRRTFRGIFKQVSKFRLMRLHDLIDNRHLIDVTLNAK